MKDKKFGFVKAFGLVEENEIDFPKKIGNSKVARIEHYLERGGCSYCFPHGIETTNSKYRNQQRSWKKYRKTKYKEE